MTVLCSFCGKSQHDVELMIAGPTVYICSECAEVSAEIVRRNRAVRYRPVGPCPDLAGATAGQMRQATLSAFTAKMRLERK